MTALAIPTSRLDRMAMALSGLCLVHCVGTAILLALLSAAGGFLGSPIIHEVGLTIAMALGVPIAPLGLLVAVEMIPDIFRTVGNVTHDVALAAIVDQGTRSRSGS